MTRILNFSNGKELKELLEIIQKEQSKNKEQLLSNTLDSLYWKVKSKLYSEYGLEENL